MNDKERERAGKQQIHKQTNEIERGIELAIAGIRVGLIAHETGIGSGVAAPAGNDEIRGRDGRGRIGGGQDLVRTVAVPAPGRLNVATKRTELRVEGVAVGRELVFVAGSADGRGLHAESRFCGLQDCVCGVAVGADGGFDFAGCDGLAVGSIFVVHVDLGVASAAGFRDVGLECRACGIGMAQDSMRSVTTLAVRGDEQALFAEREPVNRIHVVREHAGQAVLSSLAAVAVAFSAGRGHVEGIDGGAGVSLGKDGVRIAVATGARMLFAVAMDTPFELCILLAMA